RNSRVIDVIAELKSYGVDVHVHDPIAAPAEARHEYGIDLTPWERLPVANAIVAAVAHREFLERDASAYAKKLVPNGCFTDVKSQFDAVKLRDLGVRVW